VSKHPSFHLDQIRALREARFASAEARKKADAARASQLTRTTQPAPGEPATAPVEAKTAQPTSEPTKKSTLKSVRTKPAKVQSAKDTPARKGSAKRIGPAKKKKKAK
jgi:hypothetical protein